HIASAAGGVHAGGSTALSATVPVHQPLSHRSGNGRSHTARSATTVHGPAIVLGLPRLAAGPPTFSITISVDVSHRSR
ncbi:hypothetical protein, partial [Mycobacterium tuberculosis]|uniref:hypothetical protein n=1 Tax=Mycobacterium tuberculosis TaxID=1773 RepID=UPI001BFE5CD1